MGFTSCKVKQPLRGMELQEKKYKKDYRLQEICLERTYSFPSAQSSTVQRPDWSHTFLTIPNQKIVNQFFILICINL